MDTFEYHWITDHKNLYFKHHLLDAFILNGQNTGGQNPGGQNPGKIWPLGQNPRVDFQRGGQNPRHFLHLLFMKFILFKIVKSVDITRRCSACYEIYFVVSQG